MSSTLWPINNKYLFQDRKHKYARFKNSTARVVKTEFVERVTFFSAINTKGQLISEGIFKVFICTKFLQMKTLKSPFEIN